MDFGLMVHGLNYPDKTQKTVLEARLWHAKMVNGEIHFPKPEQCPIVRELRKMPIPDYSNRPYRSVEVEGARSCFYASD